MKGKEQFFAFKEELLNYIDTIVVKWPTLPLSNHFHELVNYTTDGGKCIRGLLSVYGFLEATGIDPNSEEAKPAYALGWVQEILQASFLVADDLMDQSPLRRGKPSWYTKDNNGYTAVSDSYFLENVIYVIIEHYLTGFKPDTIRSIKSLLHETTILTSIGQFIDNKAKEPTLDNWLLTVTNKTSYYTIWQPFVSGLCLSEKIPKDVWNSDQLKKLLIKAGCLFQCQDDYLDLYGDYSKLGKVGTDIQDGKCTWLLAKAMELANEEQRETLRSSIGHNEKEKIDKVREIYEKLNVGNICLEHQKVEFDELRTSFEAIGTSIPNGLVGYLLSLLDNRKI
ncbi:Farnesyl pyrophosphate synthase [Histomonas meleagridis]|uniref:Farnesyl pyrophosphate synthase n=1 Tax=Histomonas meleagridis TaxID=135588 RepID=UPI00355A1697|nr:Farnesyl pyrophosphate synthase [Histomonas meleagridis]KAH0799414.1 Farnesyl pyrophosphate synthase [Histomonas meleagridis]